MEYTLSNFYNLHKTLLHKEISLSLLSSLLMIGTWKSLIFLQHSKSNNFELIFMESPNDEINSKDEVLVGASN